MLSISSEVARSRLLPSASAGINNQATRITKEPYGALGGVREPQQSDSTANVPCMEKSLETFTDHQ